MICKMKNFLVAFLAVFLLSSCGGTTVKVRQSSDGVNATVSVQTNNPTSVTVTPSIDVSLEDLHDLLKSPADSIKFDESGEVSFTVSDLVRFDPVKVSKFLDNENDVSSFVRYYAPL